LVPPPCTGGQELWHSESDVQEPHVPPLLLPLELPLLELVLPLELPLLLLPVELLPLDDEEVDPLDEVDELEPPDDDVDDE
jgi:hypothetical protein